MNSCNTLHASVAKSKSLTSSGATGIILNASLSSFVFDVPIRIMVGFEEL